MIVIVGAGLAGLSCADALLRAGYEVEVYEASERVGGRCWTVRDALGDGVDVERGAQLIDSSDSAVLGLAAELGLDTVDLWAAQQEESLQGTGPLLHVEGRLFSLEEAGAEYAELEPVVRADHLAVGAEPLRGRMTPRALELDALSVAEYLDLTVPGTRLGRFLKTAYTWELGADAAELSALHLVGLLGDNEPGEFGLFGPADARYALRGGTESLVEGLARRVGDRIRCGEVLTALRTDSADRPVLVFENGSTTREVRAERAVLALPFSVLASRVDVTGAGFTAEKRRAMGELGMGTAVRTHLGFASRPWTSVGCNGAAVSDGGFQSCWEETLGLAPEGSPAVMVNLRTGRSSYDGAQEAARGFLERFEYLVPGSTSAWTGRAVTWDWSRHPWSLGSYAFYRPGQFGSISGAEATPERNWHFAGEHTSPHNSGMNGAITSGVRAAQEVSGSI
ncbi:flavin monoamine oxidase family protein [Nocardiopsis alba]|uniref:flavin monoamine oxidase family protein n=1 Tax=Nocardiopsis alba TaxID=53437 RepID=UPI00366D91B7